MIPTPPTVAAGLQALAVVLQRGRPIGLLTLPLEEGVTLLYGANGAGKTTILDGIDAAFSGIRRTSGDAWLICRPTDNGYGWDATLLEGICGLAAEANGTGTDQLVNLFVPQEEMLDGEYAFNLSDPQALETAIAWLQEAIRVAAADQPFAVGDAYDLALVAAGNDAEPAWDVYLASHAERNDGLLPAFAPLADRSEITPDNLPIGKLEPVLRYAPPGLHDHLALAVSEQSAGWIRHRHLGRLAAKHRLHAARARDNVDIEADTTQFIRTTYRNDDLDDPWEAAARTGEWLSDLATALFRDMTGLGYPLRYTVNQPTDWLEFGLGRWMLDEGDGTWVPVAHLGSGIRRWATLAARFALSHAVSPAIVLVDEPEAGLHPLAVRSIVGAFETLGPMHELDVQPVPAERVVACVMATTHHPEVLGTRDARLLHVAKDAGDHTVVMPIDTAAGPAQLIEELGLSMPDIVLLTRNFVLVEGKHDEAVIEAVFASELAAKRARIVVMGGASNIGHHVNAEFFTRYTSARIVVVLDRIGRRATELWDEARAAVANGDQDGALRALDAIARREGREADWLGDAGRTALLTGQLNRIHVVGLEKHDIIQYLPVQAFVPSAATWNEVGRPPRGRDFKEWLRTDHNAEVSTDRIRALAEGLDDLADLPSILDALAS